MSLVQALLESINEKWSEQGDEEHAYLTTVYIHPSLAKAIENSGEKIPTEFNPNTFNFGEEGNYFEIGIEVIEQDRLICFSYE